MWPYEEYTLLQNIIILVTPWVLALLSYFLCRPILFKRKKALQICLVLMLTLSVLQLRVSAMILFTPLQSDGLTWEMVEHDYPSAIFEDVAFLNATHGWVIGQLSFNIPTDVVVLYTDDGGDSWQLKMSEEEE